MALIMHSMLKRSFFFKINGSRDINTATKTVTQRRATCKYDFHESFPELTGW